MGLRVLNEEAFSSITDTPTPLATVINDMHGQGVSQSWYKQNLTYSIDDLGRNFQPGDGENGGRTVMTTFQHDQAKLAFELWDDLIVKGLSETNDGKNADITLNHSSHTKNGLTYAMPDPDNIKNGTDDIINLGSQVWINSKDSAHNEDSDFKLGQKGFEDYLHEIGHSLGLSHPGPYDSTKPSIPVTKAFAEEDTKYTVMSYFDHGYSVPGSYGFSIQVKAQTPMLYDVVSIQAAYGADYETRSGDTVYGFNSTAGRSVFDFNQNKLPVLTIWDGGGIDTLDTSGFSSQQTINLAPGTYSSIGGLTDNVAVAYLYNNDTRSMIENAIGGSGQDTITGNDANNTLRGGGSADTLLGGNGRDFLFGDEGNDTLMGGNGSTLRGGYILGDDLDGGAGKDTASYFDSRTGVDVSLTRGTGIGGTAQGDTLVNIEGLVGSRFADRLEGNAGDNEIDGGRGADTMIGGKGNDTYKIDNAGDKIIENAGEGTDTVVTETLKNVVLGANVENLVFLAANAGHYVGIGNSAANEMSALAFGGTGVDIELRGEGGNDTLNGSGADDVLIGGTGADRMNGGSGKDTLVMDNGSRLGGDIAIGGAGTDTVKADDLTAKAGLNLVLVATGTDIDKVEKHGYQSLAQGVEIVIGNAGGDKLDASSLTNELLKFEGKGGDDRFIASHSAFDNFDGGEGTDTAVFSGKFTDYDVKHDAKENIDAVVEKATGNVHVITNVEHLAFSDGTLNLSDALATVKTINGSSKGETIKGGSANERIDGGAGADSLHGNAGADQLFGGAGNDKLLGGSGNDTLNGGAGKDVLTGGVGNDLLTGGADDDIFHFNNGWGKDSITDFVRGHDVLEIDANGLTSMSQLTITDTAHGASIAWHGDSIVLEGISAATLHASDFHFV